MTRSYVLGAENRMIRATTIPTIACLVMAGLVAACAGGPRDPEQPFFNYGTVCPAPGMYYGSSYCARKTTAESVNPRPGYCYRNLGGVECYQSAEPYYDRADRSSPPMTVPDPKSWPPNPPPPPMAPLPPAVQQGAIQPSATAPIAPVIAQPLPPP
jgi:hypothetical protein